MPNILYGNTLPVRPSAFSQFQTDVLRGDLPEDVIQILGAAIQAGGAPFSPQAYSGDINSARDAAVAEIQRTGLAQTLYIPAGRYGLERPIFGYPKLYIKGDGPLASIVSPSQDFSAFIFGEDKGQGQAYCPQYVSGLTPAGGQALVVGAQASPSNNSFYDLTQASACRIPSGSNWTLKFKFKCTALLDNTSFMRIGCDAYIGQGMTPILRLSHTTAGNISVSFRYNNLTYVKNITVTAKTLTVGAINDFELSWDSTAQQMRFFWDGVLWTDGAWTPTGGTGSADSSRWDHKPWEVWTLGAGGMSYFFQYEVATVMLQGVIDCFHLSDVVRHTSTFAPSTGKEVADANTRMCINFDEFYKGCLIGTRANNAKSYFYPWTFQTTETIWTQLEDIGTLYGQGFRTEFASLQRIRNVIIQEPSDGCYLTGNGYFTSITDLDVLAGTGRTGLFISGGSYVRIDSTRVASPICRVYNDANVYGSANADTIYSNNYIGALVKGGQTGHNGWAVDAEQNSTVGFIAPLILMDPQAFLCTNLTLYPPPNITTSPCILARITDSKAVARLLGGLLIPSSGQAIVKSIGGAAFQSPVFLDGFYNSSSVAFSLWADVLGNVTLKAGKRAVMSTVSPVGGAWNVNDEAENPSPASGLPRGWVFTAGGWKSIGNVA